MLDNFNPNINDDIKSEAIELIDIFQGGNRVLYTADEYNFRNINFIKDRKYKTVIGENSKILKLGDFDDLEFENARELLWETHTICFAPFYLAPE